MNPEIPQCKNVQVRSISREVDLAWLAGIIDGEGNLQASVQEKQCGDAKKPYLCPKIRITNTDVRMIAKISEIYSRENIVFFYALNKVSRYKNKKPTWRDQLEITVSSMGSCRKLLNLVMPYLVNKAEYARIFLSLLDWVNEFPKTGNARKEMPRYADQPEFQRFMTNLVNERASLIDPSTTTRRAGIPLKI